MPESIFVIVDDKGILVAIYSDWRPAFDHIQSSRIEQLSGSRVVEYRLDEKASRFYLYP